MVGPDGKIEAASAVSHGPPADAEEVSQRSHAGIVPLFFHDAASIERQGEAVNGLRRPPPSSTCRMTAMEFRDRDLFTPLGISRSITTMDDTFWPFYLSALLTGFAFGYAVQRGGFCLTRALSNVFIMGDATILRAYGLALLVATVGVHLLLAAGLVEIPIRPFHWLANLVGGLIFGFGMILSGGCSASTWYRVGEGAVGAWVVLLGFAMGATATSVGVLAPLRRWLQIPDIKPGGAPPTLYTLIGNVSGVPDLSPWWVIIPLGIVLGWVLWRGASEPEHNKWPWPLTGTVVGVLIALGWWTSEFGEAPTGITFAINTSQVFTYPLIGYPTRVNWSMVLLVGMPVGAFAGAWRSGEFGWKLPRGWSLVKIFAGGLLMGTGAILAEGCNITQGLTNSATLAVGSLTAFVAMAVGAWVAVRVLYLRQG